MRLILVGKVKEKISQSTVCAEIVCVHKVCMLKI